MPLKIEDFHIEFHQRWGVYHPGQTVTGNAFLALTEPFYCDQVEVFFYGVARVFWCGRDAQLRNSVYSNEKVTQGMQLRLGH